VSANKNVPAEPTSADVNRPMHRRLRWFEPRPPGHATVCASDAIDLAALAMDVAIGARTVAELLSDEMLRDDHEERPLLSPADREALHRLSVAALTCLEHRAERLGSSFSAQVAEPQ